MGAANCQCQLEQCRISFENSPKCTNASNQLKPQNSQSKRLRSRVNSIISPRQVQILSNQSTSHLRSNSIGNKKIGSKKANKCQIEVQVVPKSHLICVKDEIVKINFCVPSAGDSKMNSSNQVCVQVAQIQQQFGLAVKYNRNTQKLSIKDNGIGLGMFKLIKQKLIIRLHSTADALINPECALIQLETGHFLILKQFSSSSISCTIIVKGGYTMSQYSKSSKSLPSLLMASCPYSQEHFLLHESEERTINNKVHIRFDQLAITLRCLSKEGIFQLMEHYETIDQSIIIRGGTTMYQITNRNSRNIGNDEEDVNSQLALFHMRPIARSQLDYSFQHFKLLVGVEL